MKRVYFNPDRCECWDCGKTFPYIGTESPMLKDEIWLQVAQDEPRIKYYTKDGELFGGEEQFQIRKERDLIKKELCEKNGITILYFSDTKSRIPKYVIKEADKLINKIYDSHFNNS